MGGIDLYCERLGPGLWAEPLNAATNAAFLIAAVLGWHRARAAGSLDAATATLIVLVALIGVASGLFHTVADRLTRTLDASAIAVFGLLYLWVYLRRLAGLGAPVAAAILAGFLAAGVVSRQFPEVLNGSLIYAPMAVGGIALAVLHFRLAAVRGHDLLVVMGVFAASLAFRIADNAVCAQWPPGTHFLWHLLNAAALYLALRALIDNFARRTA